MTSTADDGATASTVYLPLGHEAGVRRAWSLPTAIVDDDDVRDVRTDAAGGAVGTLVVAGTFLGVGTSRRDRHRNHRPGTYAVPDDRCAACRWFETRVFLLPAGDYVLHHAGVSLVPGERDLCRHERAYSAHEVVELYTVRRWRDGRRESFLPKPAVRALAQAAAFDERLRDLYEEAWLAEATPAPRAGGEVDPES